MTRSELLALAERLKPMAAAPIFDGLNIAEAADFLRQIAQAKPVAWVMRNQKHLPESESLHFKPPRDWHPSWEAHSLYTLPLED